MTKRNYQMLRAVRKAERKAREAADAMAGADAMIGTYWKEFQGQRPWLTSQDARRAAEMSHGIAFTLLLRAEDELR